MMKTEIGIERIHTVKELIRKYSLKIQELYLALEQIASSNDKEGFEIVLKRICNMFKCSTCLKCPIAEICPKAKW
jgi:hypothetical protein